MTCIVGVVHKGQVWIGGDSAGVGGWSIRVRADSKVFARDGYVFGFTSSFRMGQVLRYEAELPKPPKRVSDEWMVKRFIPVIRQAFKDAGYAKVEHNEESGGTFLVGVGGKLFYIAGDYQVGRAKDGFDAVGVGDDLAMGALYATQRKDVQQHPNYRCVVALEAAERFNAGVCGPFKVVHT